MSDLPRRVFLQRTGAAAAFLPFVGFLGCTSAPAEIEPRLSNGLFFDDDAIDRIKAALTHPRLASISARLHEVDYEASHRFLSDELRLTNRVQDMLRARKILEDAAFAFRIYQRAADLELARHALERILDYDPWDYFQEAGAHTIGLQRAPEATIAVLCALDWLKDALPPELIDRAEQNVLEKGAPACYLTLYGLKYPDRVRGWGFNPNDDYPFRFDLSRWPLILNATNLKIIPTCALGMAAAWFKGRDPQAESWLDMAVQSATSFATMYGSDGSYDEGVGYWGYTTLHLVMLAEVLYRKLGIDQRSLLNYPGTVKYASVMSMSTLGEAFTPEGEKEAYNATPKGKQDPSTDLVNFGDSGVGADVSLAAWVGSQHDDPHAFFASHQMGVIKQLVGAVWFNPTNLGTHPPDSWLDTRLVNDWIISRTGWKPTDSLVALRSGGPANHEHADRNSLLFVAHGERIFHDPFKAAYSATLPRWLLRLTEAHSAVLVQGKGHQYHDGREGTNASWARAVVTHYETGPGWMSASSDATEAYALVDTRAQRVIRSVFYVKPDRIVILDQLEWDGPQADLTARFQVYNEDTKGQASVDVDPVVGQVARINRPNASARMQFFGSHPAEVTVDQLDLPEEPVPFPYISARVVGERKAHLLSVVAVHPAGESDAQEPPIVTTPTGSGYEIRGLSLPGGATLMIDLAAVENPFMVA